MASLQPVLIKIFEVKIGGCICLSAIHYLHVDHRDIFIFNLIDLSEIQINGVLLC